MHAIVPIFASSGYTPRAAKSEITVVLNVVFAANSSKYKAKLRAGFEVLLKVTFRFTRKLNTVDITTAATFAYATDMPAPALSAWNSTNSIAAELPPTIRYFIACHSVFFLASVGAEEPATAPESAEAPAAAREPALLALAALAAPAGGAAMAAAVGGVASLAVPAGGAAMAACFISSVLLINGSLP